MKIPRVSFSEVALNSFILWFGTYIYMYVFYLTSFKPLYSYALFVGFVSIRFVIFQRTSALVNRGVQELLVWVGAFVFYSFAMFLISSQSVTVLQVLITWIESALLLVGFAFIFVEHKSSKGVQYVFVIIAVLGAGMNIYDFFQPTFSTVFGRAAGFYSNPNIAGTYLALSMVAAFPVIPRKLRLWFVVVCGLGIFFTFSRSSWLLWGLGFVYLGSTREFVASRYRTISVLLTGVIGIGTMVLLFTGVVGQLVAQSSLVEYLDENTISRLGVGEGQNHFGDSSASTRGALVIEALKSGAESPLYGKGLGFTSETGGWAGRTSTHNMYVMFWAEGGIIGLALYIWFVVLMWRHSAGIGRILAIQIMLVSLFTHNQLDQPAAMIFAAYAITHVRFSRSRSSEQLEKTHIAVAA